MNNKTSTSKSKVEPRRRFPEFQGSAEWQMSTLSDLSAVSLSNGVFNDPKKTGSGYKLINVSDMYIDTTIEEDNLSLIEIERTEFVRNKVKNGDIFFTRSSLVQSGIAYSNIYLGYSNDVTFDGHLIRFRPNKEIVVPIFVHYLLKTEPIRHQLTSRGKTATMTTIGQADVNSVKLFIPNPNEQQKIANSLSSIDNLIDLHGRKLDALKAHKKGLLQQLFPAEGQTIPRLRFPEFRGAAGWELKKLSTVAELTSSRRVHRSDYVPSGIPFFRGKEISLLQNNQFPEDVLYISEEHYEEIKQLYSVPQVGDILITSVGTLGNVYRIKDTNKFYFKDGNLIWLKNVSENSTFLEILLNAKKRKILLSAIGSSQKALTIVELNKLTFAFPKRKEQQKIADCLSSIDEQIIIQSQKIDALKAHKKGLMQQLFPSPDKV